MLKLSTIVSMILGSVACGASLAQTPHVPGEPKSPKTIALEAGAKVLQSSGPLKPFDMRYSGS